MAEFMVRILVYDETMNFIRFFRFGFLNFFWGVQGTVGALPGGWEAADEQNIKQLQNL